MSQPEVEVLLLAVALVLFLFVVDETRRTWREHFPRCSTPGCSGTPPKHDMPCFKCKMARIGRGDA